MGDVNFSLTTFDKSGKLTQIEHALARANQGKMALGIKARNGVVLVTDKKLSSVLIDADEHQKMQAITPATGFVFAGMATDFRVLVRSARKDAQKYYLMYREVMPSSELIKEVNKKTYLHLHCTVLISIIFCCPINLSFLLL
jgi:20S proteasome subunit alpha 2